MAASPKLADSGNPNADYFKITMDMKTYLRRRNKVVLRPENATMDEMVFDPSEITIYGKVVSLLRRF